MAETYTTLAARGRGYARAANSFLETNQDRAKAAEMYTKCAGCFKRAASLAPSAKETKDCKRLAEHYEKMASNSSTSPQSTRTSDAGVTSEYNTISAMYSNITFSDIGGLSSTKKQIENLIINPFTHPDIYKFYQIGAGGGIILHGAPGCGKTMIAKATAGECQANFYNIKTSDVISKYVGDAEKQIRDAFEQARRDEKAILFFDEIDSIATSRANAEPFVKRIVNELLAQMDGVESDCNNLLVMAATNMYDAIDPALLRHGRFGRHIYIPSPDQNGRAAILKIHTKNRPLARDVDIQELALLTEGFTGADIAALCENAAYIPLQESLKNGKKRRITHDDFIMALDMQEAQQ
jgi:transitional endoplasmic reticulum ATPase